MRKRFARALAAGALVLGSLAVPAAVAPTPAVAHQKTCPLPSYPEEAIPYMICLAEAEVHEVEHDVQTVVFIVYCVYLWYVHGEPCIGP